MGVSKNRVFSPQIIDSNRGFPYKPSILGYHCFWKHPNEAIAIEVQTWRCSCFPDRGQGATCQLSVLKLSERLDNVLREARKAPLSSFGMISCHYVTTHFGGTIPDVCKFAPVLLNSVFTNQKLEHDCQDIPIVHRMLNVHETAVPGLVLPNVGVGLFQRCAVSQSVQPQDGKLAMLTKGDNNQALLEKKSRGDVVFRRRVQRTFSISPHS